MTRVTPGIEGGEIMALTSTNIYFCAGAVQRTISLSYSESMEAGEGLKYRSQSYDNQRPIDGAHGPTQPRQPKETKGKQA